MVKSYLVDSTCNNMRIDRWIRNTIGRIPQGLIEKSLRLGKIKINKKKVKSSFKIKFNDKIDFLIGTYIMIILISSVSQLGDILVSYFKRLSNVKDTGNIIPGHGGLLDRVDGMIFAFPFSYIILIANFNFF